MSLGDFLRNFLKKKSEGQQIQERRRQAAAISSQPPQRQEANMREDQADSSYRSENAGGKFPNGTYCVVDLSGGSNARQYPCRFTNEAPNVSGDVCRTTELWLRRIPAGTFLMGSPEDELGRYVRETQHRVTLTRDYYIGVFEVTQKQYELVTGSNPSKYQGNTRPVECVSYNDLRGSEKGSRWPGDTEVDAGSFFGKLRAKTGMMFDLPTEAQWEYACRAGTTSAFNSGKSLTGEMECPNMAKVGRYECNQNDGKGGYGEHTRVGSYLPNAWGLYDMHGNVWEWCLDWFNSPYSTDAVTDPSGPSSGSNRVLRGGCWSYGAQACRSASRSYIFPSYDYDYGIGFRVACWPLARDEVNVTAVRRPKKSEQVTV